MSPATHLLASWLVATATPLSRREKTAVVCAGLAPDLDGLGIIPELLTRNSSHPLLWFTEYHHTLHTLAFALVITIAAWLCSFLAGFTFGPVIQHPVPPSRPWTTALLAFLSFHLHLFCDLIGSRSPGAPGKPDVGLTGWEWPIPYLSPSSARLQLTWHGQWLLNGWQNLLITCLLLLATLWIAWKTGESPLELISTGSNQALVRTLRQRFRFLRPTA